MKQMRTAGLVLSLIGLMASCGDEDDNGNGGTHSATCSSFCEAMVAAECANSPRSVVECPTLCTGFMASSCSDHLDTLLSCVGEDPEMFCDGEGDPMVEGCETEFASFKACVEGLGS